MDNKWFIWRNGGADIDGEWQPGQSWSGHRDLYPGVKAEIRILGRYRANSFGLRPFCWSCDINLHGRRYHVKSTHPSCKSINDACYHADRAITDRVMRDAFAWFYRVNHVNCVSRIEGDTAVPFVSDFSAYVKWMSLECGKYICARLHPTWSETPEVLVSTIDRFWHGYSGARNLQIDTPTWGWAQRITAPAVWQQAAG